MKIEGPIGGHGAQRNRCHLQDGVTTTTTTMMCLAVVIIPWGLVPHDSTGIGISKLSTL
eukprot:CAMPEP_0168756496 /NCGR_PEP_ID=MMETSP0724-20121128/20645_1 /TAXON_ID=265536 /ORGANISM="Amphiprora sp., Strain CCMP467" /LENGTH=58 /DNA_ID=CAMNT_0008805205 /DNA_START=76 /DNA_END=249 /DNA_ORIENTATION=-